jgi:uncharacterized protein
VGTTEQQGVTVRGSAIVEVLPDYAECTITTRSRATTAGAALEGLTEPCRACDRLLDAAGASVRNRITTALNVEPVTEYNPTTGEQVERGFTAWRSLRVRLEHGPTGADVLGTLVREATAELDGPRWVVDAASPAHDQARREAAADARRRAEAYAAGLDVSLGEVTWVSELTAGQDVPMFARAAIADGPGAAGPVALNVDRVPVSAEVTVCFRLAAEA